MKTPPATARMLLLAWQLAIVASLGASSETLAAVRPGDESIMLQFMAQPGSTSFYATSYDEIAIEARRFAFYVDQRCSEPCHVGLYTHDDSYTLGILNGFCAQERDLSDVEVTVILSDESRIPAKAPCSQVRFESVSALMK